MNTITVSAVCFERADGAVLTVRKHGTTGWMLPGGKPEPGEDARQCAIREVGEELFTNLSPEDLTPIGTFTTTPVNEVGFSLIATVFHTRREIDPKPQAEIAECRWSDPAKARTDLTEAPLNREHIYPLILADSIPGPVATEKGWCVEGRFRRVGPTWVPDLAASRTVD